MRNGVQCNRRGFGLQVSRADVSGNNRNVRVLVTVEASTVRVLSLPPLIRLPPRVILRWTAWALADRSPRPDRDVTPTQVHRNQYCDRKPNGPAPLTRLAQRLFETPSSL